MPKNILQDIVPKNQKSIRRIPIPERRNRENAEHSGRQRSRLEKVEYLDDSTDTVDPVEKELAPQLRKNRSKHSFIRRHTLIISTVVGILLVAFIATSVFASVTVRLFPKKYTVAAVATFDAKKDPAEGELGYTTTSFELQKSATVAATGEKKVDTRATGTVVIYNNDSAVSQRLIINTRLETPSGLIFRLTQSVVVPGRTTANGKITPGSVEARVQADDSGEKYNIGLTDFTIPGFKGTPKFTTFYARSKTSMTGGFSGIQKVVNETELEQKKTELKKALEFEAREGLSAKIPRGELSYPQLVTTSFVDLPDTSTSKSSATVNVKIIVTVVSFDPNSFAKNVARKTISNFDETDVILSDPSTLVVSFVDTPDFTKNMIRLSIKGNAEFIAQIDGPTVSALLAGKQKKAFNQALSGVKGLEKAEASIRPLWRVTFPANPSRIKTTVVLD